MLTNCNHRLRMKSLSAVERLWVLVMTLSALSANAGIGVAEDLPDRIIYNRGLPLAEVIDTVQVSTGSSIWSVDASNPGSTPVRLTPDEGPSSLMPSWSPGKTAVVFASNRLNDDGTPTPPLNLWSILSGGSEPVRLTAGPGHDWTAAWSPDGGSIAFASTRRAPANEIDEVWRFDIYIMNADGSDQRCLFDGGFQDEDPIFSADGATIYFVAARPDFSFQLWQAPVNDSGGCSGGGSASALLDSTGSVVYGEDPSLSPDGTTLYFSSQGLFASLNLTTLDLTLFDSTYEPWVGPDGRRFCYIESDDVYIRDVSDIGGSTAVQVTVTGDAFFPRWSGPGPAADGLIFADGFESGNTWAWTRPAR